MPAFNAAATIDKAIKSIRSQIYNDVVLIVVDDCSTDDTFSIAQSFGVTTIKTHINAGCYNAVNYALNYCLVNGYHFDAWYKMDADDIAFPDLFSSLAAPLVIYNNLAFTWCNFRRVDIKTGHMYDEVQGRKASTVMYRRAVFDRIGYYDTNRFGCDTEYWERTLLYWPASAAYHVNKVLLHAMITGQNLTIKHDLSSRHAYVAAFKARHSEIENYNYLQFKPVLQ
jgi:glycosyltransferase involved in cell wall biosynthesis